MIERWLYEVLEPGDYFQGYCPGCGAPASCRLISRIDRVTGWAEIEVMEGHSDGMEIKMFLQGLVEAEVSGNGGGGGETEGDEDAME